MKTYTLIPLALSLLTLSACGGGGQAGGAPRGKSPVQAQPDTQKQGVSSEDKHKAEVSDQTTQEGCAGLSPIASHLQTLKMSDIINGETGHYELKNVDMFMKAEFKDTHKSITYEVNLKLDQTAKGTHSAHPELICKDMSQLPLSDSEGSMDAPTQIARKDGALTGGQTVPFHLYGKESKSKDSLKTSYSAQYPNKTLSAFAKRLSKFGPVQLYRVDEKTIQLVSTASVPKPNSENTSEVRYTYILVK